MGPGDLVNRKSSEIGIVAERKIRWTSDGFRQVQYRRTDWMPDEQNPLAALSVLDGSDHPFIESSNARPEGLLELTSRMSAGPGKVRGRCLEWPPGRNRQRRGPRHLEFRFDEQG